jgi:hypothetical protein
MDPTQTPHPLGDLIGSQPWNHKFELEMQVSQAAHSHTTHSEFKTISSYLFSPKILACSSPSWPESHQSQRKGTHHPGYSSVHAGSLHWLPQGFLPGLDVWHGFPFHSTSPRAQSAAWQSPSVIWKEILESHRGCTFPGSRDPRRLQSLGVGTRYPTGLSSLISLGPPEMLWEECWNIKNKTQTQVVGGKEDLLC